MPRVEVLKAFDEISAFVATIKPDFSEMVFVELINIVQEVFHTKLSPLQPGEVMTVLQVCKQILNKNSGQECLFDVIKKTCTQQQLTTQEISVLTTDSLKINQAILKATSESLLRSCAYVAERTYSLNMVS